MMQFAARGALSVPPVENLEILVYLARHNKVFGDLAGAPPVQGPLGVDLSRLVLAWAAALTLDGDQPNIDKLRKDWGPAIAGTQTAQAFDLITENPNSGTAGGGSVAAVLVPSARGAPGAAGFCAGLKASWRPESGAGALAAG